VLDWYESTKQPSKNKIDQFPCGVFLKADGSEIDATNRYTQKLLKCKSETAQVRTSTIWTIRTKPNVRNVVKQAGDPVVVAAATPDLFFRMKISYRSLKLHRKQTKWNNKPGPSLISFGRRPLYKARNLRWNAIVQSSATILIQSPWPNSGACTCKSSSSLTRFIVGYAKERNQITALNSKDIACTAINPGNTRFNDMTVYKEWFRFTTALRFTKQTRHPRVVKVAVLLLL